MGSGGFVANDGNRHGVNYEGGMTLYVALAFLMAASGGLIFGYEIGVTGGVSSMPDFLQTFFPEVVRAEKESNNYCLYDNQGLEAFTSSLYLAGMISAIFAQYSIKHLGRTKTMFIAGTCALIGAILNLYALNLPMLLLGRIMLGCGIGTGNQAVHLYLSEVAPCNWRIGINTGFQLATIFGIYFANAVNNTFFMLTPSAWRISLGVAIFPAIILTLGGMFLPDSPQSLLERGRPDQGRKTLEKIRGTSDVDSEYKALLEARRVADAVNHPWRNLFELRNRRELVLAMLVPFFQITTGISLVILYAPLFFRIIGFGNDFSLYLAVLVGSCLWIGFLCGSVCMDTTKRTIFCPDGVELFICMMGLGIILQTKLPLEGPLEKGWAYTVVFVMLVFITICGRAHRSMWGWIFGDTVPSEIFALETGSAPQSMMVYVSFFLTFLMGQALPTMLCHFQYVTFYLFGIFIAMMIIFAQRFVPEIENDHVEDWQRRHWFWKRFVPQEPSEAKETVDAV